ncbi:hypothetical protein EPA93_42345 [Ktedonosporobacter rubrisoli]|uniref:Globin domain-containing protein n=1 Tax=Ktedonosporobacter rubrisoli TaxID=2509675 RepID=A0A4P6K2A9_KTERU|nr:globin domain-containing protein [Ktedonosporobacter rubrisoli]QBD82269.1 hypothetical protein EPA93_42345 [Ktedonosporobacter rubrisoli]
MDKVLLKESFERISRQKEAFAATFYQRLQEKCPHLLPFFANVDIKRQQTSLMATLAVLVRGIEQGDDLSPIFRKLGRVHHERHIRAEHYPDFGSTLMETLAQFDPEWTREHREAWAAALDQCVRGMMESYDPGATVYRVQISGVRTRRDSLPVS